MRIHSTVNNCIGHLHRNLVQIGIKSSLIDNGVKRGEEISDILKVVDESKIFVIVFSEKYATLKDLYWH